jgi:hypothetical protein
MRSSFVARRAAAEDKPHAPPILYGRPIRPKMLVRRVFKLAGQCVNFELGEPNYVSGP